MKAVYGDVRARDMYCCRICYDPLLLEVHHIQFRSQGGPDEEWNLISLCKSCHGRAHGLETPRLKKDFLHAMVELGTMGNAVIKTCRTCKNRDADYLCKVRDETMAPTDSCLEWVEN